MAKQKRSKEYYEKISKYQSTPEQKKRRAARGRARYWYEKENGKIPKGMEVHHIKHKTNGDLDNSPSNLKLASRLENMREMNKRLHRKKK